MYREIAFKAISGLNRINRKSVLRTKGFYLRSKMAETRLNDLSILSIESDILQSMSFDDVIKDFSHTKM